MTFDRRRRYAMGSSRSSPAPRAAVVCRPAPLTVEAGATSESSAGAMHAAIEPSAWNFRTTRPAGS